MPVPEDAPTSPVQHPKLGKPTATWCYTDNTDRPLGYVHRYDPTEGKQFRPVTLWRLAAGGIEWRWESWPPKRPLYGLRGLAEQPNAPVVVCEGEKAADAARKIGLAATTSAHGAGAAEKTDWTPLAGRKVHILPDNDQAGEDAHHRDKSEAHGENQRPLWREALSTGDAYEMEYRFVDRATGGHRWQLGRALAVRDEEGRILRWFGTSTDIDDQKRAEEVLQGADRAKNEFLANISHELRTPMNAILGMTDLALSEDLPPAARDYLETTRGAADNLLVLLNEILDLSRLEAGMFLTGGGGLLRGLDLLLSQECEVPVHLTERPLETVVLGLGAMLEHLDDYRTSFQLVRKR
jgi:PAS domain-containing protein